jgi:predicted phage terminase large subunit-like protein
MISSESETFTEQEAPLPSWEAVDRVLAERSLREFIEQAWDIVEPATPRLHNWHIDLLCEHLEAVSLGQIRKLLINIPPRTMKSLIVSVFWPVWEWTTRPATRWMFSSFSVGVSTRDSLKCRRIIESPWYRARWGREYQLTGDQNVKTRFENSKTGYRLATSVGGSIIGEGGDILVVDDPNDLEKIHSEAERESVNRWLDEVWSTRFNDPATGRKVVIQQRGHERDATGHLLSQGLGWEHICIPMEFDGKRRSTILGPYDPRQEVDEPLWVERFPPAELAESKKTLGSFGTAGQLQQSPAPAGGGIFKREHWRFYKARPQKFDEVVLSWDMTFKKTTDSDYVAGGAWGRLGADKYLIDRVKERMGFADSVKAVRAMKARWPTAVAVLVEDKANGPAIIETLTKEIPGVIAVNPEGGKEARAYAIQPEHEAGNLYLPDPSIASWVEEYIGEMASFPRGANDDEVDQTTQAVNWMRNRGTPGFFFA